MSVIGLFPDLFHYFESLNEWHIYDESKQVILGFWLFKCLWAVFVAYLKNLFLVSLNSYSSATVNKFVWFIDAFGMFSFTKLIFCSCSITFDHFSFLNYSNCLHSFFFSWSVCLSSAVCIFQPAMTSKRYN